MQRAVDRMNKHTGDEMTKREVYEQALDNADTPPEGEGWIAVGVYPYFEPERTGHDPLFQYGILVWVREFSAKEQKPEVKQAEK